MVQKYDGTSVLQKSDKYDGTVVLQKGRRYFTFAKSTTVPKYDGTSTTVLVRRYCEYYGTTLKFSRQV